MAMPNTNHIRIMCNMPKSKTNMVKISQTSKNSKLINVLKREDYKQTKHDAVFSKWQPLIGSKDWEDWRNGKEGVSRYRVHNLPSTSCPGLYELGVGQDQGRKVNPDDVLPLYLGESKNVRSRLQFYGRSGAHLREYMDDIFAENCSVYYRWTMMESKKEAEATERMLLSTFDFPWNRKSNGERRHLELLKKLSDHGFMNRIKCGIYNVLFRFLGNQVGIEIKGEKHMLKEERNDSDVTCGVILPNMELCSKRPVLGRKRCEDHKGMRSNAFISRLNRIDQDQKTLKDEKSDLESHDAY